MKQFPYLEFWIVLNSLYEHGWLSSSHSRIVSSALCPNSIISSLVMSTYFPIFARSLGCVRRSNSVHSLGKLSKWCLKNGRERYLVSIILKTSLGMLEDIMCFYWPGFSIKPPQKIASFIGYECILRHYWISKITNPSTFFRFNKNSIHKNFEFFILIHFKFRFIQIMTQSRGEMSFLGIWIVHIELLGFLDCELYKVIYIISDVTISELL